MFTADEPRPRYAAKEAAQIIAENGEETAPVINQLRRFVQRGYVLSRGQWGSGRTASNLFAVSDLATAKIIRTLTGLGLADPEIAEAASRGCYYGSQPSLDNPNGHSITEALLLCRPPAFAPDLVFQLDVAFRTSEGRRQLGATIYEQAVDLQHHPACAASIQVPLRPWLPEMAALLVE